MLDGGTAGERFGVGFTSLDYHPEHEGYRLLGNGGNASLASRGYRVRFVVGIADKKKRGSLINRRTPQTVLGDPAS